MTTKLPRALILLIGAFVFATAGFYIIKHQEVLESSENKNSYTSTVESEARIKDESSESLREILGQNLIVGIPGPVLDVNTEEILRYIKPAGIVLYRRNYETDFQFKNLIAQLQTISQEDTTLPYFIMLDEEPEGANRLGLLKNIFPLGFPNWLAIERDIGILADIGINVELAPIADFSFNDDAFIKRRVPAKTVENLIAFNREFINLLNEYGISATLKHFPGMGIFSIDPHRELPYSVIEQEALNESLKIFKDGIDHGANFVMTGHAVYENIDPDNPATFSSKIVKDILIKQLGFQGIILTDDLSDMPLAIKEIDLTDAAIQALKAGHHLIMFSHKLEETKEIFDEILVKMEADSELQLLVKDNYQKITDFKRANLIY